MRVSLPVTFIPDMESIQTVADNIASWVNSSNVSVGQPRLVFDVFVYLPQSDNYFVKCAHPVFDCLSVCMKIHPSGRSRRRKSFCQKVFQGEHILSDATIFELQESDDCLRNCLFLPFPGIKQLAII